MPLTALIMELFVKHRRIRPSSSWCWEHLFAAQMRTHKQTCSDHAWFVAVKTAFSPLLKKNACLVWEKNLLDTSKAQFWRRCYRQSVCIPSLPLLSLNHSLPSAPLLASVPMLHDLNSKSKDAGQSTRPKHQPTGAVMAIHHPLLRPRPQKPTHVTPFGQSHLRLPAVCCCRSPEWQPGRRLQKGSSITLQCVLTRRTSHLCWSDS